MSNNGEGLTPLDARQGEDVGASVVPDGGAVGFVPEIGQMIFGNPHKEYAVPDIWDAALLFIREELDRVMWNLHQKEYASPFGNTGNRFDCPTFSVHAYDWGAADDDGGPGQPWNFKWGAVEISWYKYQGRGMNANQALSPDLAAECMKSCLDAIRALEPDPSSVSETAPHQESTAPTTDAGHEDSTRLSASPATPHTD